MEKEVWKDIEGFEGIYQISNLGRVLSLKYGQSGQRKLRKIHPDKDGYLQVIFFRNSKSVRKAIHRLIAQAFISNPENKPCINHKNGIKADNRIENLEWCTRSENDKHAFKTGLRVPTYAGGNFNKGEKHNRSKLTWKQVNAIRKEYERGNITQKKLGEKYSICPTQISNIVNYVHWKIEEQV